MEETNRKTFQKNELVFRKISDFFEWKMCNFWYPICRLCMSAVFTHHKNATLHAHYMPVYAYVYERILKPTHLAIPHNFHYLHKLHT